MSGTPAPIEPDERDGEEPTALRRAIGPGLLLMFIVGDMLGGGIYALVGEVGAEVGGAIWTAFLAAFVLAALTAFAYAELVTKYPRAAGAALYTNQAFGLQFFTFMVAFAVMASGITSASTLARGFSGDSLAHLLGTDMPVIPVSIAFLVAVAALNMRGVAESLKTNVVFTLIEIFGLLLIVLVGIVAFGDGSADVSRNFDFKDGDSVFLAIVGGTTLAFYALIGFEDSVNLAEETKRPSTTYPKALFGGLAIVGVLYMGVTFIASAVVPTDELAGSSAPLLQVVEIGPARAADEALRSDHAVRARQRRLDQHDHGLAARLRHVERGRRRPRLRPRAAEAQDAVGRDPVHDRRSPWSSSRPATSRRSPTRPCSCCSACSRSSTSRCSSCAGTRSSTSTSTPRALPVLGALVCVFLITQTEAEVILRGGIILLVGAALYLLSEFFRRREGDGRAGARRRPKLGG